MKPRYFIGGPLDGQLIKKDSWEPSDCHEYTQFNVGQTASFLYGNGRRHEIKCVYIHDSLIKKGIMLMAESHIAKYGIRKK